MSLAIDKNNKVSSVNARAIISLSRNSSQGSYAEITGATYTVAGDELVLFINGSGAPTTFTLTLPSASGANYGRNLFVVQRGSTKAIDASPQIIDVDQNANGSTAQTTLLGATAGHWAHLVSNGSYWVVVSKAVAAP